MATRKKSTSRSNAASPTSDTDHAASPRATAEIPQSDPQKKPFVPEVLDRTVIAIPLLKELMAEEKAIAHDATSSRKIYDVIIDLHLEYPGGRTEARKRVRELLTQILADLGGEQDVPPGTQGINELKSELAPQYLFGKLAGQVIQELVRRDRPPDTGTLTDVRIGSAIYRIWPDFPVKALVTTSIRTVKADAALNAFSTTGNGIIWAVMDSGIDATHPHFTAHDNLNLAGVAPLAHRDLVALNGDSKSALVDKFGHGTHVAGIIAGSMNAEKGQIEAQTRFRDETGEVKERIERPRHISGMAPRCKLLSLKVLNDNGEGQASNLIAAIGLIQEINGNGRYIRVHGVNMSVGYDFEPEWFACGQSPLCVEVDRLVKSGVVVVVAAGNSGYGWATSAFKGTVAAGLSLTINDPGNAELALTVGSTHREMPHVYGVSYFSSKGPTGDGRAKPDLVAPGEKIISCASGWRVEDASAPGYDEAMLANAARLTALEAKLAQWQGGQPPASDGADAAGVRRPLQGGQRHQHGGAACFGGCRRFPVRSPRVHWSP